MNFTVCIEKIIPGGRGLARREDGMVVLTGYVLPGETVLVRETVRRRGYCEAVPVNIVEPSPDRLEPPCPFYTQCGGCDFQHISYPTQLRIKDGILNEAMLRAGVVNSAMVREPIISSTSAYRYRHRIRLKLSVDGRLGFFRAGSNEMVAVQGCPVATDTVNTALAELNGSIMMQKFAPLIREIDILHSPADNRIFLLLHPDRRHKVPASLPHEMAATLATVDGVSLAGKHAASDLTGNSYPGLLHQDFISAQTGRPYTLQWSPGCFYQVNPDQNTRLIGLVERLTGKCEGKDILDLFCGMGNFSLPLALDGARVTGVEQNRQSITWARNNTTAAGVTTASFAVNDVGTAVRTFIARNTQFDIIVLDPPRQGLGKDISLLAELSPEKIIYISCDPATLMRDIAFAGKSGYDLTGIFGLDMFPQTHHIEAVALLEKN